MFPTPYTVGLERFTPGTPDAHNNPVDGWGSQADVEVYGWAPPVGDSQPELGRPLVVRDLDLYTPPGVVCGPKDRWTIDGETFLQVGHPEDFTNGPWGWAPGYRVNLKRFEG